jgi:hypothetical protein
MGGKRPVLLFAAAALLLVVVAARGASPVPSSINDVSIGRGLPSISLDGSSVPGNGPLSSPGDPETLAKVVVALVVILFVLAIVMSVLSWLRTRRRLGVGHVVEAVEGTVDGVPRFRLKEAVRHARDVLAREGGPPRDAVIEAWVILENAAEHKRAPHETATEFTVALLAEENADEAALRELRTLYQRARFGTGTSGTVDDDSATRARDALDRILATIR